MPRVHTAVANRGATKTKTCSRPGGCEVARTLNGDGTIVAGEKYHSWSFRYGGTYYQHAACGYPKPSQLTHSKMSTVLAAIEGAQDEIARLEGEEGAQTDPQDILGPVAEAAREVAEEYREAAEAMGGAGEANNERADELDSFADSLESFDCSEGEWEAEEPEDETDNPSEQSRLARELKERAEAYVETLKDELSSALDEVPGF